MEPPQAQFGRVCFVLNVRDNILDVVYLQNAAYVCVLQSIPLFVPFFFVAAAPSCIFCSSRSVLQIALHLFAKKETSLGHPFLP
jgi:hypothetical protein